MSSRLSITIPIQPWFRDHHFNGRTIFPAVESMRLLAGIAKVIQPDIHPESMTRARFLKFLELPEGVTEIATLVEHDGDGETLCLRLLSKIKFKKMSRIREHAEIHFRVHPELSPSPVKQRTAKRSEFSIDAERIYRELIPFGPAYRSLTGKLHMSNRAAWATLLAPDLPTQQNATQEIGSVFPFDGAMHAACIFGQCVTDFVPFPVGFSKRSIHTPTRPGEQYTTTVIPLSRTENEIIFNLSIFDTAGQPCETVTGLRMRDVSGGTLTPPENLPRPAVFPPKHD